VAEIYDYSALGPDPLRELIEEELGLEIKHIRGGACILDRNVLPSTDALGDCYRPRTRDAAKAFRARCASLLTPKDFYKSVREGDNSHPWANISADVTGSRSTSIRPVTSGNWTHRDVSPLVGKQLGAF
jgi:hypothetical protein